MEGTNTSKQDFNSHVGKGSRQLKNDEIPRHNLLLEAGILERDACLDFL